MIDFFEIYHLTSCQSFFLCGIDLDPLPPWRKFLDPRMPFSDVVPAFFWCLRIEMYATNRSAVKALLLYDIKGGSRVHMYKYVCVCAVEGGGVALLSLSHFLK